MDHSSVSPFTIFSAGPEWQPRIREAWGDVAARHMHFGDGFTLLAQHNGELAGLIAIVYQSLPAPLQTSTEAFIDIIEVAAPFRRQGLARQLLDETTRVARAAGAVQLRAWSSVDKTAALHLWQALGFGLCPATTYHDGRPIAGYFVAQQL